MIERRFTDSNGTSYIRTSKAKARALYKDGNRIFIAPCNLIPFGVWRIGAGISNACGEAFDTLVNEYEYYNCVNAETGKYAAFYIKEC